MLLRLHVERASLHVNLPIMEQTTPGTNPFMQFNSSRDTILFTSYYGTTPHIKSHAAPTNGHENVPFRQINASDTRGQRASLQDTPAIALSRRRQGQGAESLRRGTNGKTHRYPGDTAQ